MCSRSSFFRSIPIYKYIWQLLFCRRTQQKLCGATHPRQPNPELWRSKSSRPHPTLAAMSQAGAAHLPQLEAPKPNRKKKPLPQAVSRPCSTRNASVQAVVLSCWPLRLQASASKKNTSRWQSLTICKGGSKVSILRRRD